MNYNRSKDNNPNWKGGISSIKVADDILDLSILAIILIKKRLLLNIRIDDVTRCWNWIGSIFQCNGRACINFRHRVSASRVSYVLYKGSTNDLNVLHTCDNILCVNPEHLWLGTNAENSKDMVLKGRTINQVGEANHAAKLNDKLVVLIRKRYDSGEKQNKLAKEFRVSKQTINNIVHRKVWSHI